MAIRKLFDVWLKSIDNTRPDPNSSLLGASFEEIAPNLMGEIGAGVKLLGQVKNALANPQAALSNFAVAQLDSSQGLAGATYQVDVNIWQIDGNNNKVYGYKLQNAFPKNVGIISLEDGDENTMSEFTVTMAFSEFIPLHGGGLTGDLSRSILGDQTADLVGGIVSVGTPLE